MTQRAIPCVFMRGGTSKGPFLDMRDLPSRPEDRDRVLLAIMGSPDRRQIDGLGGADFLTSKVVIAGPSVRNDIDVDYLFAQIHIDRPSVDTRTPCGNMMAGVGPFAIETGMVEARDPETTVRIHNVNTETTIDSVVQTPGGSVSYEGTTEIDGVPGTAAPIRLNFLQVAGAKTGKLLPTDKARETLDGVDVSLVDAAMPMMLLNGAALGLRGDEDRESYQNHRVLMTRIERMRCEAGERMGLGDVRSAVIPKVGLLFKTQQAQQVRQGGSIRSHYLTPHSLHAAHAVTGGICVASACIVDGTIANELSSLEPTQSEDERAIVLEHPSGRMEVHLTFDAGEKYPNIRSAGIVRTARKIMAGHVFVPETMWPVD